MSLIRLDVSDFRNLNAVKLEPFSDGFNLIYGKNGSGKTSLLESIYYLGFGRSFRSTNVEHVVRKSTEKLGIFGHIQTKNDQAVPIGVERHKDGNLKVRLAGKDASSIAELASLLPIQLINSQCYSLLDAGPVYRRKYLDWGTFYLNTEFLRIWRQFKRALKQRNACLLKSASRLEIDAWSDELATYAIQLDEWRQNYIKKLLPIFTDMLTMLLPAKGVGSWSLDDLAIEYYPGWKINSVYRETLSESLNRDLQLGYTQMGPHRADLRITLSHLPAKDILSRGQQKLFVCAMILAQGELLHKSLNKRPIYLIDDLPSELDLTSRSNLITLLSKQEAQVFVTAVDRGVFNDCLTDKPVKLFHVEHGNLTSIVE